MITPIVTVENGVNDPESVKIDRVAHVDRHLDSLANGSDFIPLNAVK